MSENDGAIYLGPHGDIVEVRHEPLCDVVVYADGYEIRYWTD